MRVLVIHGSGKSLISKNSIKLMFGMFMMIMASNCNSEVNVKSETARLIGTLRTQMIMGSSPREVMIVLQRHNIEYSAYQKESAMIDAIVRDVVRSKLGSTSIKIKFFFEKERLSSYRLEKTFTGN